MQFVYRVRDVEGRIQEAMAQADSSNVLRARLTARGLDVIEIKAQSGASDGARRAIDWPSFQEKFLRLFESVSLKDMVVFSRQFAAMVSSEVGMLRTLTIIVEQCNNKKLKRTLDEVRHAIES